MLGASNQELFVICTGVDERRVGTLLEFLKTRVEHVHGGVHRVLIYEVIDVAAELLRIRIVLEVEEADEDMGYSDPYYDLFLAMGKKRGCVMSGGRVDEERFARTLLTDLREGRIGRITLEDPEPPVKGN